VATQPIPANHRKLGSDRKASFAKGFEFGPLEAEVDEVDELSSSALRSFGGDKCTLLVESKFFSGGAAETGITVVGCDVEPLVGTEEDRRNKFGAWLLELEELVSEISG